MMKKNISHGLVLIMAVLVCSVASASNLPDEARKGQIVKDMQNIRVPFVENKGQINNGDVKFYASTFGGTVFVNENGFLSYNLPAEDNNGVVLKEIFTDKNMNIKGLDPSPASVNYFIGKDKNNWKTDIPSYNRISLGEVYKGIEVTLQVQGNTVEKLFTVSPNESPEQIKVKLDGCKELIVNGNGELEVITELGAVKFTKPIAFQEINGKKKSIDIAYAIHQKNSYSFQLGNYDQTKPLVIDPLLASTFIGAGLHHSYSIITDDSDNVYVAGITHASYNYYYPTTPGAYNETRTKNTHLYFISKLNSNLSSLMASTFIGSGEKYDYVESGFYKCNVIAFDRNGNIYITGDTRGYDYPTTSGAYSESCSGRTDIFISKLSPGLNTLIASTLIGGYGFDQSSSIAVDRSGNVYIVGSTDDPGYSQDHYPVTSNAYDKEIDKPHDDEQADSLYMADVVISKLNSNLTTLLASTFIGGRYVDRASSIVFDSDGNVYVAGSTMSPDFPTTSGAFDRAFINNRYLPTIFISKLNSNLSTLLASTFIGHGRLVNDWTCLTTPIAIDESDNVYIAGSTSGSSYPTTPGAPDKSYDGQSEGFVSKLNSDLSKLLHSTFIGGKGEDICNSIALDGNGNVYVTGYTKSNDYPTTPNAYDNSFNPLKWSETFISKFDSDLTTLLASTYFGGSEGRNEAYSIAVGKSGNVYVAGLTGASDFPTTIGAYDEIFDERFGIFVSKLDGNLSMDSTSGDDDGDGYTTFQGDCNDNNKSIHPGAIEICGDGIDQDCDGQDKQCIVSDIKANGIDGPINITSTDKLSITIELFPGGFAGKNVDWWLVEAAPSGLSHYLPVDGSWASGLTYSHQGPLFNLGEFEVLNISGLPAGSYTFYFGVDVDMNGLLDMDKAHYDWVTVNIQ